MFTKKILSHIILSYLVISTTILPFPVNTNTQLSNETKDSIATPNCQLKSYKYFLYHTILLQNSKKKLSLYECFHV